MLASGGSNQNFAAAVALDARKSRLQDGVCRIAGTGKLLSGLRQGGAGANDDSGGSKATAQRKDGAGRTGTGNRRTEASPDPRPSPWATWRIFSRGSGCIHFQPYSISGSGVDRTYFLRDFLSHP